MAKFKVGDRVKVKNWEEICKITIDLFGGREHENGGYFSRYMKIYCGETFEIHSIRSSSYGDYCVFSNDAQWWWYDWMLEDNTTSSIHIYTDGTTTTAILKDGKKTIKTAQAKCSPDDTYDFNIGAKLAFERLMGEEKQAIKEVKRKAKVGEWIRVFSKSGHPNGTGIFKVTGVDSDGWVYVNNMKYGIVRLDQYVVLENYKPTEDKLEFVPHLKSGKSFYGNIGEETTQTAFGGEKLYVGDVVELYSTDTKIKYGERAVCKHKMHPKGFVMGVGWQNFVNGISNEWQIRKVKSFKDVPNGEVINGVKYVKEG